MLAEGWNEVTSSNDPTAHAEVTAIRRACQAVGDFSLEGATLYTSCEPCPMCLASAYWARISGSSTPTRETTLRRSASTTPSSTTRCLRIPADRAIQMEHLPTPEASAAFAAWLIKTDKITY